MLLRDLVSTFPNLTIGQVLRFVPSLLAKRRQQLKRMTLVTNKRHAAFMTRFPLMRYRQLSIKMHRLYLQRKRMSMSQTLQRRLPGICQFRLSVKNLLRVQMRRRKGACSVWRLCKISILRPVWMIVEVWRSGPLLPSNLCIARLGHKMIIISLQYEVKMLSNLFHPEPNPESVHLKVQMSETWISPRRGRRAATQLFPVSTISDLGTLVRIPTFTSSYLL